MKYLPRKSITFSILALLLSIGCCIAQETVNTTNDPVGSAANCQGKSLIINCFISEKGESWTPEEKDAIITKENAGFEWIKKQARNWNVPPIAFQQISIGYDKDITVEKIARAHEIPQLKRLKVHWATYALNAAGYNNVYHFYDSLKKLYQVDNVAVLVFANKEGRSYAQPTTITEIGYNKDWFLEGAVLYKHFFDSEAALSPATIIHNLLVLFGAWEIDRDENRSNEAENLISGGLRHSIVFEDRYGAINVYSIDQLTAWRIGWIKSYFTWYEMFRNKIP